MNANKLFCILIVFGFSIACNFSNKDICHPISIKITNAVQIQDGLTFLFWTDSILGYNANEYLVNKFPERFNDTTLSLTNRLEGIDSYYGNKISMEENKKLHPLLSICYPFTDRVDSKLQKSAFIATSLVNDTELINSYFNLPEIRNRYLKNYHLKWAPQDGKYLYAVYATNEYTKPLELDSSYIDSLSIKENENILCLLPGKEVYYLIIHLKQDSKLNFGVNYDDNYNIFELHILDKNFVVSVQGLMLSKGIKVFDQLTEEDIKRLRDCYGDLVKE